MFVPPAIVGNRGLSFASNATGDAPVTLRGTVHGDVAAVSAGIAVAGMILVNRHAALVQPDTAIELAAAAGTLACALVALPIACVASQGAGACSDFITPTALFYVFIALGGALLAVCLLLAMSFAPRYITSAEVALLLLGETVLSPVWVYVGVVLCIWGSGLFFALALRPGGIRAPQIRGFCGSVAF